jgi:hypothetical protein
VENSLVDWQIVYNADEGSSHAVSVLKGKKLSASDFAYVPDRNKPSTWKLRIDDARHVAGALAALGKGFRGKKVSIPASARAGVERKVHAAWRKHHKGERGPTDNDERRYPWDYNEPGEEGEEDYDELGDMLRNQDEEEEEPTENDDEVENQEEEEEPTDSNDVENQEEEEEEPTGNNNPFYEDFMAGQPTGNAKHTPLHEMNDDEFHEHRKAMFAEQNRRDMNNFMGLTYRNPGNETPSSEAGEAYEYQDPHATDYMEEFKGLGLSFNEAQELRDLLGPTMNYGQPSIIDQLFASRNPKDRPYQEAIRTSVQNANRERGALLQHLTANMTDEQRAWTINKYRSEPIEELRRMVQAFAPPTFNSAPPAVQPDFGAPIFLGGSGGAAFTNNQAEPFTFNQAETNGEPLPPSQATDWAQLSKDNLTRNRGQSA